LIASSNTDPRTITVTLSVFQHTVLWWSFFTFSSLLFQSCAPHIFCKLFWGVYHSGCDTQKAWCLYYQFRLIVRSKVKQPACVCVCVLLLSQLTSCWLFDFQRYSTVTCYNHCTWPFYRKRSRILVISFVILEPYLQHVHYNRRDNDRHTQSMPNNSSLTL
jgi:hypothetical protein